MGKHPRADEILFILGGVCLNASPRSDLPLCVVLSADVGLFVFPCFTGAAGEVHGGKRKPG